MNSEEQTLIDGLFSKLRQAETDSAHPRDTQAEARIKEHFIQQPAAAYYMAQSILVQEAAVNQLNAQARQRDEQIQQLQAQIQQLQAQLQQAQSAPAPSSGGFLSSIFGGGGSREPQPQPQQSFSQQRPASPPPSSGGGWRDGPANPPPYNGGQQGNYAPPPQQQAPAPAAPIGSGFLGGALKTAAGVAGGVMLAEGISSLFHHNSQPQEIVEVIQEQPSQVNDNFNNDRDNGWGNDQQRVSNNDDWGNNNQDSFADSGYNDDGGSFDDDDSFV